MPSKTRVTIARRGYRETSILMNTDDVGLLKQAQGTIINIDGRPQSLHLVAVRFDTKLGEVQARIEYG